MTKISKMNMMSRLFVVAIVICMMTSVGMFFMIPQSKTQVKAAESNISTKIWLQNAVFDTRLGEPELDTLMIDSYPKGMDGYYIVQKKGYVTEEWKSMIGKMGGEIMSYIPDNAFIVKMNDDIKEKIDAKEDVQWTGMYQPAYKISPNLKEKKESVTVTILLFKGESSGPVILYLKKYGEILGLVDSPYGDRVRAVIDPTFLGDIAMMKGVHWIEEYSQPLLSNPDSCSVLQNNYYPVGERHIHAAGLSGDGQIVCVADSGIRDTHEVFADSGKIIYNYVAPNSGGVLGDNNTDHGTHTSASVLGDKTPYDSYNDYDGHGYQARLIFQDIGKPDDPETPTDETTHVYPSNDLYGDHLLPSYENGSRIHSNSWGGSPGYTFESAEIDRFIWDYSDMTIVFSAGNSGPDNFMIDNQAESKNVICAGGDQNGANWQNVELQSSRGPASDWRIKPDILAPFTTMSADSEGDTLYRLMGGTSMSTPAISGEAAMIREYFAKGYYPIGSPLTANEFSPSAALVKAIFINSAVEITGSGSHVGNMPYPNYDQGWGVPNIDIPLWFSGETGERELAIVEQTTGLMTSDYVEYFFSIDDDSLDFEVTLVWSDYPGDPGAAKMLVNDLDLLITSPGGAKQYRGNNYAVTIPTESVDTGVASDIDDLNNIECVYIKSSNVDTGEYTVRIDAKNVVIGPQPFALVVTGGLTDGYGKLMLDKGVYGDSDNVYVRVEDTNALSVSVDLTSSTGDSETIILTQTGIGSGIWESTAIPTESEIVTVDDGKLQVEDQGTITASYDDVSPVHTASITARTDIHEPRITDVDVQNVFGTSVTVVWETEENANSTVYYGTSEPLSMVEYDDDLMTHHRLLLKGLAMNTKYYFDVESTDWYGRTANDDNGGVHYSFRTTGAATANMVLLVDDDDASKSEDSLGEPFEVDWINNLEEYGWSYIHWDYTRLGAPTLADMNQCRVVVWYVDEGYPQIDTDGWQVIMDYLDQATNPVYGTPPALFIDGQDIGWDSCDPAGTEYIASGGASKTWYETYMAAIFMGDDADGGGGKEGSAELRVIDVGHPLNFLGFDQMDLEETAYSDRTKDPARFWPEDIITNTTQGGVMAWDYVDNAGGDNHSHGGDSAAVSQTNCPGGSGHSRVLYYSFASEMIGTWDMPNVDATRAGMLDQAIRWLLDIGSAATPEIALTYPVGGETESGTCTITWTAAGNPNKIDIYYSPNHGWAYELLDTVAGTVTSYGWDTTTHPDGIYYKIKVIATNEALGLTAADESGEFTVDNGNDNEGPVTIPGSVVTLPNPVDEGGNITINATIDDSNKGNTSIAQAEAYIDGTTPSDLIGTMSAVDGSFNSPIEDVTIEYNTSSKSPGMHTIYVRGKDNFNNWGAFEPTEFKISGNDSGFQLNFAAGLNLISLPLNVTDPTPSGPPQGPYFSAQDLIDSINADAGSSVAVYKWDGAWYSFYDGDPASLDFEIKVWEGYFVKCTSASIWMVHGTVVPSESVPLSTGLNLIGISMDLDDPTATEPPQGPYYSAQDLINEIKNDGGSAVAVYKWDGAWYSFYDGDPASLDFAIERGSGYFVKCTSASDWTP